METPQITPEKAKELTEAAMRRLRWRLWFAFAESKYDEFCYKGNKKKPHWNNIKKYCLEHWNKEIGQMTKEELSEKIAIVKKWKNDTEKT